MFWILGIFLCVVIAFWPAMVAKNKGHSFLGYFVASIFFWWITLFVVYFGLKDKNETAQDRKDKETVDKLLEKQELAGKK